MRERRQRTEENSEGLACRASYRKCQLLNVILSTAYDIIDLRTANWSIAYCVPV